jgi:hypothetical protein
VSGGNLLIDVRQLSAGIFQEEFALDGVDAGKNIGEDGSQPPQEGTAVLTEENVFVGNKKPELIHKPETENQQNGYSEN